MMPNVNDQSNILYSNMQIKLEESIELYKWVMKLSE